MEKTLTNLDGSGGTDLTPIQVTYELKYWARVPPVKMYITADSRSVYEAVKVVAHNYEGRGCDEDTMSHSEQDLSIPQVVPGATEALSILREHHTAWRSAGGTTR